MTYDTASALLLKNNVNKNMQRYNFSTYKRIEITKPLLRGEIYKIPIDNNILYYAPLTRFFMIGEEMLDSWIDKASSIENVPDFIKYNGFNIDKDIFKIRVNITSDCNLSCVYCSVNASKINKLNMNKNQLINYIDLLTNYAENNNYTQIEVTFSGGEPTIELNNIISTLNFLKDKYFNRYKFISIKILTNGLWDKFEFSKILKDVTGIQISWDGYFLKNPRYSNEAMSEKVLENIEFLVKEKVNFSVLTVVSYYNYLFLDKVVDHLYEKFGIDNIFLSLQDNVGRATKIKSDIDYSVLENKYLKLWKTYRKRGIDINMTGTNIHAVSVFPCYVPMPNYSIDSHGRISSCTISFNYNDANSQEFIFGSISETEINISQKAIKKLRKFNVLNLNKCKNCFAKWHCRGGCPYSPVYSNERCEMIRNIVREKVLFLIEEDI